MANPGDWSLCPGRQVASRANAIGHRCASVIRHLESKTIAHQTTADFLSSGLLRLFIGANSRKERAVGRFWANPNDVPAKVMTELAEAVLAGSMGSVEEAVESTLAPQPWHSFPRALGPVNPVGHG
jgi:hypothetical protein